LCYPHHAPCWGLFDELVVILNRTNYEKYPYLADMSYMWSSVICIAVRAVTWPGNKHVDLDFFAQSVVIPVVFLTGFVQMCSIVYHVMRHYMETRLLIAARQEYKVVSFARGNITLAGWSVLTPPKATKELALRMLKLEGEFPLAAKMPLKIELEESFDFTRAGQAVSAFWSPWQGNFLGTSRLKRWCGFEAGMNPVAMNSGECLNARRSRQENHFLPECPDYTQITEWIKQSKTRVERLLICSICILTKKNRSRWKMSPRFSSQITTSKLKEKTCLSLSADDGCYRR
jgi:hypothetical protein